MLAGKDLAGAAIGNFCRINNSNQLRQRPRGINDLPLEVGDGQQSGDGNKQPEGHLVGGQQAALPLQIMLAGTLLNLEIAIL